MGPLAYATASIIDLTHFDIRTLAAMIESQARGSAALVLMAKGKVHGEWQNSTPRRSETPQPIDTKFERRDCVCETTPGAKFRANPSIGGFSANG